MSRSGLRADIQGLRALAVLIVVAFHTGVMLPGGYVGVDVFFVLSGYLIIGLLDREAVRSGRIDLADFFARRVRRLLPALATVTVVTVLASSVLLELGAPLRSVVRTATGASLFAANIVLYRDADYFAPASERNPLLHTWSLSVEEQFYFAVPIVLALVLTMLRARGQQRSRRWVWAALLLVGAAVSFVLNVLLVDLGGSLPRIADPVMFAFYAPVTRAWQFAAGGLLALVVAAGRGPRRPNVASLGVGLGLITAAALAFDATTPFPGSRALTPVVGTLLVLAANASTSDGPRDGITRVLSSRAAQVVGDRSYSIYLWHWPAIVLTRAAVGEGPSTLAPGLVVALALTAALSWASYRWVEEPFRRDHAIVGSRAIRVLIVAALVPITVALAVGAINGSVVNRSGIGVDDRVWARDVCLVSRTFDGAWPADQCTRGPADAAPGRVDVLVLGDSHANALSEGVLAATEPLGVTLGVWTVGGLPPLGDAPRVQDLAALIEATRPRVVILAAKSASYLSPTMLDRWLVDPDRALAGGRTPEELWGEALERTVLDVRSRGAEVIWVQTVPEFPDGVGARGPTLLLRDRGLRTVSPEVLALQRGSVHDIERRVLAAIDGVVTIDPAPWLCAPECRNGDAGVFHYHDSNHLNRIGSLRLADAFAVALHELLPNG